MSDLAREANFTEEILQERTVLVQARRQEFQRDRVAELQVIGSVNFAHAAFADERDDSVTASDLCSREKAFGRGCIQAGSRNAETSRAARRWRLPVGENEGPIRSRCLLGLVQRQLNCLGFESGFNPATEFFILAAGAVQEGSPFSGTERARLVEDRLFLIT